MMKNGPALPYPRSFAYSPANTISEQIPVLKIRIIMAGSIACLSMIPRSEKRGLSNGVPSLFRRSQKQKREAKSTSWEIAATALHIGIAPCAISSSPSIGPRAIASDWPTPK